MRTNFYCLFALGFFYYSHLHAISMVYNFRIAQITKQPTQEKTANTPNTFLALLFDQYQERYNGDELFFNGGFGSYIYNDQRYYVRADSAVSRIKQKSNNQTIFSDTETDDILFTLGRHFALSGQKSATLSTLFGLPTHRVFRLQHPDFGYGQFSVGIQLDGTIPLDSDDKRAFLWGARYIYFIPRTARDNVGKNHSFTIGNTGDLFLAYKENWGQHGIECGYTPRFQFGAAVFPHFDATVQKVNYTRSSFYAVYKYRFMVNSLSNRLLFNIGYGFDHTPKVFGNKHVLTLWASWNVSF